MAGSTLSLVWLTLKEFEAKTTEIIAKVEAEGAKFLLTAGLAIEAEAKAALMAGDKRDTGKLLQSIQTVPVDAHTVHVGTNLAYAMYVHGYPPNPPDRSKPHMPPIAAITPWATRHNIPPFLVARAIAKRGTTLVPFMTKGIAAAEAKIAMLWEESVSRALR